MSNAGPDIPRLERMGDRAGKLELWRPLSGRSPHDPHGHEVFVATNRANPTMDALASARATTRSFVNGAPGSVDLEPVDRL
jgi:hypothetical protein